MTLVSEYNVSVSTLCATMPCRTADFPSPHSLSVLLSRFIGIQMTEALLHDASAGCGSKMLRRCFEQHYFDSVETFVRLTSHLTFHG